MLLMFPRSLLSLLPPEIFYKLLSSLPSCIHPLLQNVPLGMIIHVLNAPETNPSAPCWPDELLWAWGCLLLPVSSRDLNTWLFPSLGMQPLGYRNIIPCPVNIKKGITSLHPAPAGIRGLCIHKESRPVVPKMVHFIRKHNFSNVDMGLRVWSVSSFLSKCKSKLAISVSQMEAENDSNRHTSSCLDWGKCEGIRREAPRSWFPSPSECCTATHSP